MADEAMKPSVPHPQMPHTMHEIERNRLTDIKKSAYDDLYELAEMESGELYDQDDECEEVEYMLEKVMKDGTYHDAVHGIHHFIDYVHANNALKCL